MEGSIWRAAFSDTFTKVHALPGALGKSATMVRRAQGMVSAHLLTKWFQVWPILMELARPRCEFMPPAPFVYLLPDPPF